MQNYNLNSKINLALILVLGIFLNGVFGDVLILTDGQILKGKIVQVSFEEVKIRVNKASLTLPIEQLSTVSQDLIYRQFFEKAKTFEKIVELGDFCEKFDLLRQAISCYKKGKGLADLTEEQQKFLTETLNKLETEDAKRRFNRALEAYEKKDYDNARGKFSLLKKHYPNLLYGEEAQKMILQIDEEKNKAKVEGKAQKGEKKKKLTREEKKKAKQMAFWEKKIQEANKALAIVDQKNVEGLQWQSKEKYQKGAKAYEAAEKMLTYAENIGLYLKNKVKETKINESAKEILNQVETKRLIVYMNFSHLWAVSLNWSKATLYVNRVLAVDPGHEEAKRLRLKITEEQIRRNK